MFIYRTNFAIYSYESLYGGKPCGYSSLHDVKNYAMSDEKKMCAWKCNENKMHTAI